MAEIVANNRFAGTEEVQPAPGPGTERALRFLALPDGGFITLWTESVQSSFTHVVGRRYDVNGRQVGDLFQADAGASQYHLDPSIASVAGGGFVVAWRGSANSFGAGGVIQGQLFDPAGQKVGGILPLNSTTPELAPALHVVGLASGGFVLVWGQGGGAGFDSLRGQVHSDAGVPVGGEFEVKSYVDNYIQRADVAALPGGGFVVVWDTVVGGLGDNNYAVRGQRFSASGTKVGGEIAVNTTTSGTQWEPSVAALPGDGFVVAWMDGSGNAGYRIKGQVFDLDGLKVGDEIVASPGSVNGQSTPTVAANADGEFVIGWTERYQSTNPYVASTTDVLGRLFDSAGAPIGDPFVADLQSGGQPGNIEAVMLASGAMVLGWETYPDARLRVFFPVVEGTAGDDALAGGDGRDFLYGLDGNDQISGGLGDDFLLGGAGEDGLDGGEGNDELEGGDGDDDLFGGAGDDVLDSGAGDDDLDGGEGDDRLLVSGAGADSAAGGTGNDTLVVDYSALSTAVVSSALSAGLPDGHGGSISAVDRSVSFTGIERFEISTGSGNDDIRVGAGDDFVSLGAGDDRVDMGTGLGSADGGDGLDGIAADLSAASRVNWSLPNGWFSLEPVDPSEDPFQSFEYFISVVSGSGYDTFITTAYALDDDITTGGGNDYVQIIHGHDAVRAGIDSDTLSVDYSSDTAGIVTTGFAGSSDGTGYDGRFGNGERSVTFTGVETFSISTGSGNDVIRTGAGNDIVRSGGGDDFVDVGTGAANPSFGDSFFGGEGIDGLSADLSLLTVEVSWNLVNGTFGYYLQARFGQFEYLGTLTTGSGPDIIATSNLDRDERINTGAGYDIVTVMNGDDVVDAGAGAVDILAVDYRDAATSVVSGPLTASAGGGYDGRISAGDRSVDFIGVERIAIFGGSAADDLRGGVFDDVLDGGGGADILAGGDGNDLYRVDNASDVVIENAGEGIDTISTTLAVFSLAGRPDIENLTGAGPGNQSLTGNANDNVVTAGAGNDFLYLWVGGGNDTVDAGGGNDAIFFGATLTAADLVNGGGGVDTLVVQGPYGSLTLSANVTQIENVSILGGGNTSFGEPGTNRYDYVLTTNDANFAAGVQARINGAALLEGEDFTFDGSAETDASYVVYGGRGKDTLLGGLGNDIFFLAEERFASGDMVNGGAGYDGMFLRGNYTIDFNAPGYTGLFTNIENLTLTSATDERYARGGGSEFDYNLTLSDAIVNAGQILTISGTILMASETMILDASQESDGLLRLFGGKADDTLKGGGQADLIHGNLGADTLAGNAGADMFRYDSAAESNTAAMDRILDFTPGTDRIDLSLIDANMLAGGNQGFSWIGSSAFSGTAGELRAYEQSGTWFVEGDTNGDGVADLAIALTLQGPTPLGAGDFLL